MKEHWRRTFLIIWSGQLISILSSAVVGYAIIFWLSIETGSAEILAIAAIAAMLPQAVLGLFTGVYIDRWNRKLVMILSDCFIALCTLVLVILFSVGKIEYWHIYLLAAARSVGSAFHMPAMQASLPLLAPESKLMRIAGVNQMIHSISAIGGPALGALLLAVLDMKYVLLFDIAGALFAATTLLFVVIPNPEKSGKKKTPHVWNEMKESIAEIRKDKGLAFLFLFSVIATFFIMPIAVMFPLMTINHFNGTVFHMSVVEVFWGAGMLAGGALAGIKLHAGNKTLNLDELNKATLINYMYIIFGLTFFFSGILSPAGFIWFVILTAIGGVSTSVYNASFTSLIQLKIDPAMLGRVFSVYMSFNYIPSMIGLLGTGFIADRIGLINAFIICGFVNFAIGLISLMIPSIRRTGISTL